MKDTTDKTTRSLFATRLGVIAATVGSSVGLGNIWRFPYEAGTHGGAAFIMCYICFILAIGIPVICAEFVLGRQSRSDVFSCFKRLGASRGWGIILGYGGIASSLLIISFYSVVAGWTMEYLVQACTGALLNDGDYSQRFLEFSTVSWRPLFWTLLFLAINHLVVRGGVQKGIERVSNILMPLLFAILVALAINSLFLPGAKHGLTFLFKPDFEALTPTVILSALGQAFFSLSIGLGCMLTYASYFNNRTPLLGNAAITAGLDTLVAIVAGIIIFPAVFTFGVSPSQGPALVFEVLPSIFGSMPGGIVIATLFFLMLFVASLTSTISMSEISIAYFQDNHGMKRHAACGLSTIIAMVGGTLCTLSFNGLSDFTIGGHTFKFFDICNNVSSNILLPIGGILISVYVGWFMDRKLLRGQLTNQGTLHRIPVRVLVSLLRYVCPVAISIILISPLFL